MMYQERTVALMLKVENIRFGYVPSVDIFRNVTFTIEGGEYIAIGGRNGCGKTTITRLLVGLEKAREGHMYYNGRDITSMPPSKRGQFIGYVFQQPDRQMFRPTVATEVAFGPESLGRSKAEVKRIVDEVLARTGIGHLREAYPPTLRRGEKQRVAIASALAMQSKILILDEPTSGQDGKETKELLALLRQLNSEGITILLITHDMEIMASECSRAIIMGNQTVAFDGSPEELFKKSTDELQDLGLTKPPSVELSLAEGHMERLVPLTKILMTLAVSVWAILLRDWVSLLALVVVELGVLFLAGLLFKQRKAVLALTSFAVFLGLIQFLGSGDVTSAIVSGLRMLAMTLVFIGLLATTKLQDLTAALVTQCKIPYEYAFMFTAALRFVPDFIAESHAVQEAQACRGLSLEGNFIKRIKSYASVIQPLLLKSLGRSETMALSLELRGFGGPTHSFAASVGLKTMDYAVIAGLIAISLLLFIYI